MKVYFKNFMFFAVMCFIGCQDKNAPLYKAMEDIEVSWSKEQLKKFAQLDEEKSQFDIHFGAAMNFRNKKLRNPKDSTLIKYFHSLEVYHLDDMSGVVLGSLHRKLNNKPIDLEGQLKMIYDAISKTKALENKNTQRALKYYGKYQIGDTLMVRTPINEYGNAVRNLYPDDSGWIYNDSLDLLIKGVITKKSELKDTLDMFFNLKVISLNRENVKFLMEDVKVGDEIEGDFRLDIIEDVN